MPTLIRMNSERRGNTAVVLIVLIVVAVIIGFVVVSMGESVGGHLDDYMAMYDNNPRGPGTDAAPQGKAVVVDYESKKLDDMNDFLPASRRAEKDADVQTVIITIRASTGLPGAGVGVPIASGQEGFYSISALVYDRNGTLLRANTIKKTTSMTGAGAEAEAGREVTRQMADWINARFEG